MGLANLMWVSQAAITTPPTATTVYHRSTSSWLFRARGSRSEATLQHLERPVLNTSGGRLSPTQPRSDDGVGNSQGTGGTRVGSLSPYPGVATEYNL
jgi:hypothetical protein